MHDDIRSERIVFFMTVLCRALSCCLQMVGRLLKFNNEVVYEHLLTPQVLFPLDYLEMVLSVCDIMCLIKSMEHNLYGQALYYSPS